MFKGFPAYGVAGEEVTSLSPLTETSLNAPVALLVKKPTRPVGWVVKSCSCARTTNLPSI